jgi:hypothetical protein
MTLRTYISALAASLALLAPASAQTVTADEAREDLASLYQGLQEAHYDLFASTPRAVFEEHYERLSQGFEGPVELSDLHREFQRFTALARHAHARVEGLNPGFGAHLDAGGLLFPLDLRIKDGAVIVVGAPAGSGVSVGEEVLAINGEPNAIWLARITRNIAAETPELAYSQLERLLPYFMWLEYEDRSAFSIAVAGAQGPREVELLAVDYDTYASTPNLANTVDLSGRHAAMLNEDIAYLRPGGFFNLNAATPTEAFDPEATRRFIAFIDTAFESFIEDDAEALILDLRNNPGGDNSYSDPVIAWFADEPFRFYSQFRLRVSAQTTASNATRLEGRAPDEAGVSGVFADLFASHDNGDVVLFEIDDAQPHAHRFDGEVYVLIDRTSYSNAAVTAALIQDYGFGTIVGEATTDMATSLGALEQFYLPHSGLQIGYPKAHIIRPNGEERLHPVTPDIEIRVPVLGNAGDAMLDAVVALVEA